MKPTPNPTRAAREESASAALRDNLRKRKAQEQARTEREIQSSATHKRHPHKGEDPSPKKDS